jgi:hypothetical protein
MSTIKTFGLVTLVGLSLTANVLLLIGLTERGGSALRGLAHHASAWVHVRLGATRAAKIDSAPPVSTASFAGAAPHFRTGATTFERLLSDDPATFAANLLAVGFTRIEAHGAVTALLRKLEGAKLLHQFESSPPPPFWKTTASTAPTAEQMAEFNRWEKEKVKTLEELFPEERENHRVLLSHTYGALPEDKLERMAALDTEYAELRQQLTSQSNLQMPWTQEQQALLDQEKQKDVQALLTPAELEQYNFRTSPVAVAIRQMPDFNPSEQEFRELYDLKSAADDRFRSPSGNVSTQEYLQAQKDLNASINAALGDERFAAYQRSSDRGFQAAYNLAQQLNLPTENASAAYQIQTDTIARAAAIRTDPNQTPEQRSAQLRDLAATANQQLAPLLTPAGVETYKRSGGSWLQSLERSAAARRGGGGTQD